MELLQLEKSSKRVLMRNEKHYMIFRLNIWLSLTLFLVATFT